MNPHLIENLRHHLDRKGISMNELSRQSGLGQTGIYDIINSRSGSPTLKTLEKIASALETTVADLLRENRRAEGERAILAAFEQLPAADRERLLQTAQAWLRKPD